MDEFIYEDSENDQEQERGYFVKQEEKINKTKEKLQALLEKLQEQPPKDTISKKILRLRINRLRTQLNRRMAKFDIEYLADLDENYNYEYFVEKCDEIRSKIKLLEDEEDDLEFELEHYARKENYTGKDVRKVTKTIEKMAPKRNVGNRKQNIKNRPTKNKTQEMRNRLSEVKVEIEKLQNELEENVAKYKEYKVDLKAQTKEEIAEAMETLKEQEKQRKKQQKEQLAVTKPSIWSKIKNSIKTTIQKVSDWNERRKTESAKRSQKKDDLVTEGISESLNTPTKRQQFREDQAINPIIRMYIEESKKEGFDRRKFVNNIVNSKKFTIEQMRDGMAELDRYVEEEQIRKNVSKTVSEIITVEDKGEK